MILHILVCLFHSKVNHNVLWLCLTPHTGNCEAVILTINLIGLLFPSFALVMIYILQYLVIKNNMCPLVFMNVQGKLISIDYI